MKIIEKTNSWTLYSDGDVYVLNTRCNFGIVEATAEFMLLDDEIRSYNNNGKSIIDGLSEAAKTSHGKNFYERSRPISDEVKIGIRSADEEMFKKAPGFEWLRKLNPDKYT